jgi:hypothetical protein
MWEKWQTWSHCLRAYNGDDSCKEWYQIECNIWKCGKNDDIFRMSDHCMTPSHPVRDCCEAFWINRFSLHSRSYNNPKDLKRCHSEREIWRPTLCYLLLLTSLHYGFLYRGSTLNEDFYLTIVWCLQVAVQRKHLKFWREHGWFLYHDKCMCTWCSLSSSSFSFEGGGHSSSFVTTLQPWSLSSSLLSVPEIGSYSESAWLWIITGNTKIKARVCNPYVLKTVCGILGKMEKSLESHYCMRALFWMG